MTHSVRNNEMQKTAPHTQRGQEGRKRGEKKPSKICESIENAFPRFSNVQIYLPKAFNRLHTWSGAQRGYPLMSGWSIKTLRPLNHACQTKYRSTEKHAARHEHHDDFTEHSFVCCFPASPLKASLQLPSFLESNFATLKAHPSFPFQFSASSCMIYSLFKWLEWVESEHLSHPQKACFSLSLSFSLPILLLFHLLHQPFLLHILPLESDSQFPLSSHHLTSSLPRLRCLLLNFSFSISWGSDKNQFFFLMLKSHVCINVYTILKMVGSELGGGQSSLQLQL